MCECFSMYEYNVSFLYYNYRTFLYIIYIIYISVGVGAFVIGLSQISSFFSLYIFVIIVNVQKI